MPLKIKDSCIFSAAQGLDDVLPQMPEILEPVATSVNELTCKFCDEVFEQPQYLDDHIEEMHQVKEPMDLQKFPMAPPDHFNIGEEMSLSDFRTTISFNDQEDLLSNLSDVPSLNTLESTHDSIGASDISTILPPPKKPSSSKSTTDTNSHNVMSTPSKGKSNRCLICLQSFDSFAELKNHVSEEHKPRKKTPQPSKPKQPRKCLICKQMLSDIDALKEHVNRLHSTSHNNFESNSGLTNGTQNVNIDITTHSFPDFSEFDYHHTNEIDLSNLDQNLLLNNSSAASLTDENIVTIGSSQPQLQKENFKCNQCNRTFKYKWNYEKDQEMHRKQKQKAKSTALKASGKSWMLDCPHCSETFVDKIARIQYIKKAHETQPKHNCAVCGEEFPRNHLLNSHMETEHNVV